MNTLLESQVYWRLLALAQQVPDLEQVKLFDWVCSLLSGPLNTAGLDALSLELLKERALPELAQRDASLWPQLLATLHGELPAHLDPRPLPPGEGAGQLRVAFASTDGVLVNGHFGSCPLFFIYQVSDQGARLVDIRRYSAWKQETGTSGSEGNEARAELLQGCHLLFCEAIGGPAAARVIRHGIHPVKIKRDPKIQTQLEDLTQLLQGQLPPWLAKALGRKDDLASRFDLELEE